MLGKDLAKYCESRVDCFLCDHLDICDNFSEHLSKISPDDLLSHNITEELLKFDFKK